MHDLNYCMPDLNYCMPDLNYCGITAELLRNYCGITVKQAELLYARKNSPWLTCMNLETMRSLLEVFFMAGILKIFYCIPKIKSSLFTVKLRIKSEQFRHNYKG